MAIRNGFGRMVRSSFVSVQIAGVAPYILSIRKDRQRNLVWYNQNALPGTQSKPVLTWADGNYHLYESFWLADEEPSAVEESIFSALNEAVGTSGRIKLNNPECEVRWCLLEEEQMSMVMDIPD